MIDDNWIFRILTIIPALKGQWAQLYTLFRLLEKLGIDVK